MVKTTWHCQGNNGDGADVLIRIKTFSPGLTAEQALRIELRVGESVELPLVFAMAVAWGTIWDLRQKKIRPHNYLIKAQLEAKVSILREFRQYTKDAAIIDTFIETL